MPERPETCAHCGRPIRRLACVDGAGVCHTDWKPGVPLADQDDCYRLVTVYGERLGSRILSDPRDGLAQFPGWLP